MISMFLRAAAAETGWPAFVSAWRKMLSLPAKQSAISSATIVAPSGR